MPHPLAALALKAPPGWARVVLRETTRPVFLAIPARLRPYLLAMLLFAVTAAMMTLDHAAPMRYGLPWSLVAILIVVAAANFWGARPALAALAASVVYEAFVPPHFLRMADANLAMLLLRTLLFAACGLAVIWLTDRALQMQERVEIKRQVVGALQSMILPDALPPVAGCDISPVYRPARYEEEVGGDFYDVFPVPGGRYGLLIGDVMGKGKEAAASTALLRYTTRAYTEITQSPARVVEHLNSLIEAQQIPFATATLFLGLFDPADSSLTYCNAGHEPPLLLRDNGLKECLMPTAPVIGIGDDIVCDEETLTLAQGDALLLFTDGVTECRDKDGAFLGEDGAWRLFANALPAPTSSDALAAIDAGLQRFAEGDARDDVTLLLVRREGSVLASGRAAA